MNTCIGTSSLHKISCIRYDYIVGNIFLNPLFWIVIVLMPIRIWIRIYILMPIQVRIQIGIKTMLIHLQILPQVYTCWKIGKHFFPVYNVFLFP